MSHGALAVVICCTCALAACAGEEPKAVPGKRDVDRLLAAVSDVVYQCGAVDAGYVKNVDAASIKRDVDFMVDAWDRLRPDSRFRTATGTSTLGRQARLVVRRLEAGCAPSQGARLREALED
jgi:hypothetical protein